VPLIVIAELFKAELGIEVKLAPDPLKTVADNVPVLGLYLYFVELVYTVLKVPDVVVENNGYSVALVVVSSVIVAPDPDTVCQVGAEEPLEVNT